MNGVVIEFYGGSVATQASPAISAVRHLVVGVVWGLLDVDRGQNPILKSPPLGEKILPTR
jgi:hypothetical protein